MIELLHESIAVVLDPAFFPLHAAFVAVFGLLVGSFLNVCIWRLPAGLSIVYPGSHCTTCGHYLKWFENVPVLSWAVLGGQCRRCGTPFSPRYALVELLTSGAFLAVFWVWRYNAATPLYLVFTGMLIVGTFTDIDHWIIPDSLTWGGAALALAVTLPLGFAASDFLTARSGPLFVSAGGSFDLPGEPWVFSDVWASFPSAGPADGGRSAVVVFPFGWRLDGRLGPVVPFCNALIGAAFGFGLLWGVGAVGRVLFRKEAMGMGDMKLFAFIGAVLGAADCLWVLFAASVLGVVGHVSLGVLRRPKTSGAGAGRPDGGTAGGPKPGPAECPDLDGDRNGRPVAAPSPAAESGAESAGAPESPEAARERRVMEAIASSEVASGPAWHPLPFGPYIALAAWLVLLFHDHLGAWFRWIILGVEQGP
ncbi:MAG: hypothetical protein Kow0059_16860 [Candidatus Sumerlaeia bacterium]